MSQFPNMNQPAGQPNPFAASASTYQQPPKKSNVWLYILLGVGGAGLLVCCGCGGFGYMMMGEGFKVFEQNLQAQLSASPAAQEHLGEIQSVKMNFMEGVARTEKRGGQQTMVFNVVGSKGSAEVYGDQPPFGGQAIMNPIIVLPSGQEIPVN
jgi:hypothetical protein